MANQVIVTSNNTVQVSVEPTPDVQVTISRTAVGTIANVPTANYANFAGNVVNAAQPNITSVGTLTNLNVANTITTNNLVVTGNFQVGNLVANTANYANFAGNAFAVAGANVSGTVANATYAANAGFATTAGSANTSNTATVANSANSVTLANVSGAGNIASINLDGSASNVLYGNGAFAPAATGNVANANYANFAGTAFSVSGSNVSGTVANATYAADAGNANTANSATVANSANAVAGANVSGTVANATYALNAGNANIANIAYSVSAANVSGLGNIATINLDGNVANVLKGNGTFGPEGTTGNANYANFAGTAFSVSGSNVSGAVANATFADNAGNANIANTAYSVSAANVSGLGNIATINLDGNVSNLLTGNGTYVAIPTVSANANYANFAGDVVNATQSNITQTGNLVSLTINDGSSINTSVFEPTGATVNSNTYISVNQRDIANNSSDGIILANASAFTVYRVNYLPSTGNTIVAGPTMEVGVEDDIGVGNVAVPGSISFSTYNSGSNLTTGDGNLVTSFGVADGVTFFNGAPFAGNSALFSTFNYGMSADPASSTLWRSTRRRGNGTTRLSLEPNDYLGNIEWRGARGGGALPTGSRFAKIAPRVDSSYVANSSTQPVGIEFWVTDNTTARSQIFHANGDVTFANVVNATTFVGNIASSNVTGLGNIATINLDGNASNLLNGAGSFVAIPTVSANANYANFAGDVVNATQSNITQTGNLVSLTVDANIANSTTVQVNGNLISYAGANYYSVTNAYNDGAGIGARGSQAIVLVNGDDFDYSRNEYYINKGGNAKMAYSEVAIDNSIIGNSGTDPLIPGSIAWTAYTESSNLANASTTTGFQFTVGGGGLNILTGAPVNTPAMLLSVYGDSPGGTGQQGIRFRRRGGNNDSRTNVAANYYLGNIEWQGASTATGGFNANATVARVAAKVESTYANTGPIPTAIDLQVSNGTTSTHQFHANGNVTFSNAINANRVTANYFYGDGSNITGITASTAGTVTTNAQPNITSVGTLSSLTVSNNSSSQAIVVNQEGNGGISSYNMYTDTSVFAVQNFYRTRGNSASRTAVGSNDTIFTQNYGVYGDSGNTFVNAGYQENKVGTNYGNGQVSLTSTFAASYAGSSFNVSGYDNINLNGNVSATYSNVANTQLNRYQETTFAIGNVSGTITPDFNNGSIQSMTLTGNITLNSLGNAVAGRSMTLILTQDGTGGKTLTSSMLFAGGSKTLSTAAAAIDIISVFYDGTTYYASLSKGYA